MIQGKLLQLIQGPRGSYCWALYQGQTRAYLSVLSASGIWLGNLNELGQIEGDGKGKVYSSVEEAGDVLTGRLKGRLKHGRESDSKADAGRGEAIL